MTKRQRTEGQRSTKHTHKTKYRLWLPVHEEEKPFSFDNNNYSASLICYKHASLQDLLTVLSLSIKKNHCRSYCRVCGMFQIVVLIAVSVVCFRLPFLLSYLWYVLDCRSYCRICGMFQIVVLIAVSVVCFRLPFLLPYLWYVLDCRSY